MIVHRLAATSQAASQERTSLRQADPIVFFHSPTGAHPRLISCPGPVGVCASPSLRDPSPNYDPTKAPIQHVGSWFRAGLLPSTCRIFGERRSVMCHQIGLCQTPELQTAVPIV